MGISTASILFVDDDPCMREVVALILSEEGYEVSGAEDGLDALIRLRNFLPDLIISDLHMPRMSGVEFLSVVRRRFPTIPVIAMSGAYDPCESSAAGVMADVFFPKGGYKPDGLAETIHRLIYEPLKRPTNYHPCNPQRVQLARRGLNREGMPVLQLTCTECLRSISATSVSGSDEGDFMVRCQSCGAQVHFVCDVPQSSHLPGLIASASPVGLPAR